MYCKQSERARVLELCTLAVKVLLNNANSKYNIDEFRGDVTFREIKVRVPNRPDVTEVSNGDRWDITNVIIVTVSRFDISYLSFYRFYRKLLMFLINATLVMSREALFRCKRNVKGLSSVGLKLLKACQDIIDRNGWFAVNRYNILAFKGTRGSQDREEHLVSTTVVVNILEECSIIDTTGVGVKAKKTKDLWIFCITCRWLTFGQGSASQFLQGLHNVSFFAQSGAGLS